MSKLLYFRIQNLYIIICHAKRTTKSEEFIDYKAGNAIWKMPHSRGLLMDAFELRILFVIDSSVDSCRFTLHLMLIFFFLYLTDASVAKVRDSFSLLRDEVTNLMSIMCLLFFPIF